MDQGSSERFLATDFWAKFMNKDGTMRADCPLAPAARLPKGYLPNFDALDEATTS